MAYLPFARKWRPQDFDEIVGQEHITTTLKNAISMGRLHHAYLFAGPRGIGKTSTARIFSKALNCEKGLSMKPCNACSTCKEITAGSSMDVIEIDGASNRGIDEIRNLRETVKFSPSKGQFKIYIIDEVHMLTTEAFNALLKTLEEPPMHVKFIFATTEPHKVLPTILSRCQRFDFRRIQTKDIVAKLLQVSKEEALDIEEDAFLYIAKASDGSMRDAESILDQIASFGKGKVYLKDVIESLGMIDQEILFRSAELIINKDTKALIHLIDEIVNSGKDAKQFLLELLGHFRNIMILKSGIVSDEIINLPKDAIGNAKKQADSLTEGDIFYIISVISNGLKMIKQLLPERIVLEVSMIKLSSMNSIASIEEILSMLKAQSPGVSETPAPKVSQQVVYAAETKPASNEKRFFKKIPESSKPVNLEQNKDAQIKSSIDIARVKDAWPILVKAIAVKKISISSYLAEGEPDSVKGDTVIIGFPKEFNFHREVLEEKHSKDAIEQAFSQIMDTPIKISFVATDMKQKANLSGASTSEIKEVSKTKDPVIDSALNMFGGRIFKSAKTN